MSVVQNEAPPTPVEVPERVDVRFTLAGVPLAIRYAGRIWAIAADPVRWYEREPWWDTQTRAPIGVDVVNVHVWRVQVRINTASPLRTMEIRRRPLSPSWVLSSIDDTV
ncbi:hypothetical protein [Pseudarthrobacter sp. PS3-L1]|uniref:hypothetical protein n=1 Tax=Pseudarthrobacter sp. PS3-L1 TaxID=3046207 RepID=UPI0024BA4D22|nr:hypothetical protein [Pseudarthrobacter sp. PS3-L1]MDJ0318961.1 hypothetical protein [Pseudarthrobacter sp. PS3-L1]